MLARGWQLLLAANTHKLGLNCLHIHINLLRSSREMFNVMAVRERMMWMIGCSMVSYDICHDLPRPLSPFTLVSLLVSLWVSFLSAKLQRFYFAFTPLQAHYPPLYRLGDAYTKFHGLFLTIGGVISSPQVKSKMEEN